MTTAIDFSVLVARVATRRSFGRAVHAARVGLDMTRRELAIEAETTEEDISDVETGQCMLIGVMRRCAYVLGIEKDELLEVSP